MAGCYLTCPRCQILQYLNQLSKITQDQDVTKSDNVTFECNVSGMPTSHISFTAVLNNGGIEKGIGGIRKGTKKNYIYVM